MKKIIVVCEGQTEQAFINELLYPILWPRGVFVEPRLISTSPAAKGGALSGQRVIRYLRNTLRERQDIYVTTFFDLYALPRDFPGWTGSSEVSDPLERATEIETELHAAVVRESGCSPERFFPHIQPYEFEALLFSDLTAFTRAEPEWRAFADKLSAVRRSVPSPEHINNGADTHPSARLQNLLRPSYSKVIHGVGVCSYIGIDSLRAECRHFDGWFAHIKTFKSLNPEA